MVPTFPQGGSLRAAELADDIRPRHEAIAHHERCDALLVKSMVEGCLSLSLRRSSASANIPDGWIG